MDEPSRSTDSAAIIALVAERGPLSGREIGQALPGAALELWRSCLRSSELTVRAVGRRYLRLDRQVEGFGRLSPSILREFMTYSVIGLSADLDALDRKVQAVASHIKDVSRAKRELAHSTVAEVVGQIPRAELDPGALCVILAGDVVYEMAHDVPRPERSTGKMVKGSDLDLVLILDDRVPDETLSKLDQAIHWEKYRLLRDPARREEIDYIVKRFERVREQVAFDDFKRMVACKILHEGVLLYGSESLFEQAKSLLVARGVAEKLDALERAAELFRKASEQRLIARESGGLTAEERHLVYSAEESEEFE